jgi:tRNA pseudouridine38-40 synthase
MRETVRAAVEYDGTAFYGFQRQPMIRTVAGVLEEALATIVGERVAITGAGRTDSGVHATGQVISFRLPRRFPIDKMPLALNATLPRDLSVREATIVFDDFSARFSAISRTYVYAIYSARMRSALLTHYTWHVYTPLDIEAMQRAAQHIVGQHDLRSFCAMPEKGGTLSDVASLRIDRRDKLLRIEITADRFLHHMVRAIVGTLVECGRGKRNPDSLPETLLARDRATAGPNAPAHGLYLAGVHYADGYDSFREPWLFRNC